MLASFGTVWTPATILWQTFGAMLMFLSILAATALYLYTYWLSIPERFPMHWGISGEPDGLANRDWHGVYGLLIMAAFVLAALLIMGEAILRGSPRASTVETATWTARFRPPTCAC